MLDHKALVSQIRSIYGAEGFIPLHRPVFSGSEKEYLVECIDSNFVSSVGERVTEFEQRIARFTGSSYAIATMNGTAALHTALLLAGVSRGDEILTQALTFVATCNAIGYAGAEPVFLDVDEDTMGLSPAAITHFLETNCEGGPGGACINRMTGRRIAACLPMHTFGHPARIEEIISICMNYGIPVVEDAAESLGSYVGKQHTGTFGQLGTLSFNGNKVITTGGGGMILTDDEELASRAKHLTTTAKSPHGFEFFHDQIGYNYRLPNLNAALGCAQMERLSEMLDIKRVIANHYHSFFSGRDEVFIEERKGTTANYWLNAVRMNSHTDRDELLEYTNRQGVMTRPIWRLMIELPMYENCWHDGLETSRWLEERIVNLPSSVPDGWLPSHGEA